MMDALPEQLRSDMKIQFCSPSGADAVEAALKLVKIATGKRGILAFSGSYHGMTNGALSVTSMVSPRAAVPNLMADVVFLPYPYSYRCPFGLGGQAGEQVSLHYIEQILSDPFSGLPPVAGIIIEVIQGEGGVIPASDAWMRALRELTYKYHIPLIVDEIQTGIGRTGAMFSFEHSGITPDVILISKSIGGSLPLSMILYNKALDKWESGAHVGTFRGNQLAMAAGSAVLRTIKEEGLLENCSTVGQYMFNRLLRLQDRYAFIGDVRGRGLMIGVEIVNPEGSPECKTGCPVWPAMSLQLQQACFRRGLIIELGGRGDSTARFLPPINIDLAIADTILDIFESAIEELNENC
jgi:diaminobutyrate-2-oxoglutarate transaminase